MYNKILVPLDSSELAECALTHAKEIAKGCRVPEVDLLYVVEELPTAIAPMYVPTNTPEADREKGEAKIAGYAADYLKKVAGNLSKDGVAAKPVVLKGNAAEKILDYASKNAFDLIIMSTHGRSGPSRWAMGSVADRVLRHSQVPVLIASPKGCRITDQV